MTQDEARLAKEKYKLTDKQLAFCELYLENQNAQRSYMIAYKNDNANTAGVNSTKLMKKEKIASYIAEGKKKMLLILA